MEEAMTQAQQALVNEPITPVDIQPAVVIEPKGFSDGVHEVSLSEQNDYLVAIWVVSGTIVALSIAFQIFRACRRHFFQSDEDYMREQFIELELAQRLNRASKEPLLGAGTNNFTGSLPLMSSSV
mmetsp:Transcript_28264/g.34968  ORF Transcript_28264/g.34968 Transcript_28264/m.34968 type:complete len:125 (-) Transcript_28264:258-632(-)